jgi:hypothetical protein
MSAVGCILLATVDMLIFLMGYKGLPMEELKE